MGNYTVEEYKEVPPIAADTIFPAKIVKVEEIERTINGEPAKKIRFKAKISAPGTDWDNFHYNGEVFARLTEHPDNQFRVWVESLLGHELPVGYDLDTEKLVDLNCRVAIGYREYKKDGKDRWANFISDVLPAR
jgi:hypothetical protein